MQRDRDLDSWAVFCRVAETGSISEACEILNMDASAVSRIIRGLEESLGKVPLFDRSMRPLKLTKNGEIALGYAREMLEGHRALRESLQRDPNAMAGTIHIGLPPLLLHNFLLPLIIDFHNRFPEIYLKINEHIGSTPLNFDTPKGRLDIMMGYGADPLHPNIVQIYYAKGIQIPCASPLYLSRRGTPQHPRDLREHTGIIFDGPMRPLVRQLSRDGETCTLSWGNEIFFDSAAAAQNAAFLGAGIHPGIPTVHAFQKVCTGELTPVLTGWEGPETKLYIYVRPEVARLRKVQVFIEWYRAYMDELHERCAAALEPYLGRKVDHRPER